MQAVAAGNFEVLKENSATFEPQTVPPVYSKERLETICAEELQILLKYEPGQQPVREIRDKYIDRVVVITQGIIALPREDRDAGSDLDRGFQDSLTWLFDAVKPQIKGSYRRLPKNQRLSGEDYEQELKLLMIEEIIPSFDPDRSSFTRFLDAVGWRKLFDNCGSLKSPFTTSKSFRAPDTEAYRLQTTAVSLSELTSEDFVRRIGHREYDGGDEDTGYYVGPIEFDGNSEDPALVNKQREFIAFVIRSLTSKEFSEKERQSYLAVVLGGISLREYAHERGAPYRTVVSWVARARKKMNIVMETHGFSANAGEGY